MGSRVIETFSGRLVNPFEMTPSDVSIVDITHSLSRVARWTGHASMFWSVAEHSVTVADLTADTSVVLTGSRPYSGGVKWDQAKTAFLLAAMLHDASEAYICDLARPLKQSPEMEPYRVAEARIMDVIYRRFGLAGTGRDEMDEVGAAGIAMVGPVDDFVLLHEYERFLPGSAMREGLMDMGAGAFSYREPVRMSIGLSNEMQNVHTSHRYFRWVESMFWHKLRTHASAWYTSCGFGHVVSSWDFPVMDERFDAGIGGMPWNS